MWSRRIGRERTGGGDRERIRGTATAAAFDISEAGSSSPSAASASASASASSAFTSASFFAPSSASSFFVVAETTDERRSFANPDEKKRGSGIQTRRSTVAEGAASSPRRAGPNARQQPDEASLSPPGSVERVRDAGDALAQAKRMLDDGLVSREEYDEIKRFVLLELRR